MLAKFKKYCIALMGLFSAQIATAAADPWQMNMHRGVTPLSKNMYDLHMMGMIVCAVIGVIVFGIMIYSLVHHRKSRGFVPATFHDHRKLEVVWTVIPFLILVGLAIPATKVLISLEDASESDITIKVVGSQWKWQYQYLDQGISFFSNLSTPYNQINNQVKKGQWYLLEVDKPLVLPVNKKIRFLVTSTDVVHSWWVPRLGVKRDAIPGFMHESWAKIEKPGMYRGQCTELCGINHGFMPIVVKAVTEGEFNNWVTQQPKTNDVYAAAVTSPTKQTTKTQAELLSFGQTVYEQYCGACHMADGKGIPPLFPAIKNSSVAVGKPIFRHLEIILNGVPGTAMQAYKDQLSDDEIAAVTTYERNAWGNNTNDTIQAADVAEARKANVKKPTIVNKAKAGGFR
jgi:cytochrome c oxidase subunit 2